VATFYRCEQNAELTQSSLFLHPTLCSIPPPPTHTVVQRWWWWWYDRQWHWFSPNGYFQLSGPFLHCCEEYVPHKHLQEGNILFFPYIFFYMMIFLAKISIKWYQRDLFLYVCIFGFQDLYYCPEDLSIIPGCLVENWTRKLPDRQVC
jgi:hypothetical protein